MSKLYLQKLILSFLEEDLGTIGDITTASLSDKELRAEIIAKEDFILCGAPFFEEVFRLYDNNVKFEWKKKEGESVFPGEIVGIVLGNIKTLLTCERTALNILQRLSGIATETKKYVDVLKGSKVKLLDTRKTTPGLRYLEKYATRIGGAFNHRLGLYDAVMIKDNHIKPFGSVITAVKSISSSIPVTTKIEVEVENEEQLQEVMEVIELVDIVMLDNWNVEKVEEATLKLKKQKPTIKVEVSGNITIEKLKRLKYKSIDFVSTSKIITGAKWVDISMEVL
ncbi:nicotinate-nucleotide pyrophosphorylase [Desulfurobacterium thermolithotrophum DSM 11699]|uniref:Probable nicotinate-nucleotide pyrophosphorylase [carboxylating] n=1 Tax=Desulfurobacterium thermolithotrophum (strain DSM 11699 / BSA) TaxID=868864 RepID=F0S069_DESTD|nr:carboxylating nicotinate-nucleotide diphosphorylase [Desulfurobacterium thermolithotrophum]ADY73748.1 nicotinate-nucleotide pyrophosphorylase [Desulfurobacterium thermolithotrophum DSM 11699]